MAKKYVFDFSKLILKSLSGQNGVIYCYIMNYIKIASVTLSTLRLQMKIQSVTLLILYYINN